MNKLFTVEVSNELVEIYLNDEGINILIDKLNSLKKSRNNEHEHLMTPDIGGNEITSIKQNLDSKMELIHHLKLVYWKDN